MNIKIKRMKSVLLYLIVGLALISCKQNTKKEETTNETAKEEQLQGVTSEVLKTLKVSDIVLPEGNKPLECRGLRLRMLTTAPGVKITVHSHENRPAILTVVSGKGMDVTSYHMDKENPEETVRLLYGESYAEFNKIVHYAVNLSKTDSLRLTTFDFLEDGSACNGKKYPQHLPVLEKLKKENHPFYANNSSEIPEAEYSKPIFYVPLADIKFPEGSASLNERYLRTRKVTLEPGKSLPQQNYSNRPTYVFVLEGALEVAKDASDKKVIKSLEAEKLINHGEATIRNASNTEKVVYITMELWDPADKDIL